MLKIVGKKFSEEDIYIVSYIYHPIKKITDTEEKNSNFTLEKPDIHLTKLTYINGTKETPSISWCAQRTQYHLLGIHAKNALPQSNLEKILNKHKLRGTLENGLHSKMSRSQKTKKDFDYHFL